MISDMVVDADRLGKPEIKSNKNLTFEYYLASQSIIQKYLVQFKEDALAEQSVVRRELRTKHNEDDLYDSAFEKSVRETANFEETCLNIACQQFYEQVKVDQQQFFTSHQTYSMDPTKRAIFEEAMAKI